MALHLHPTITITKLPLFSQNPRNFFPLSPVLHSTRTPVLHSTRTNSRVFTAKQSLRPVPRARASSEGKAVGPIDRADRRILVASAVTVVLAVANRVLYKLALVPMKNYPFFLAQVTTFGYVAVYFFILYLRYHAGIVTKEMMALLKSFFMSIGLLEALGVAAGMSAGGFLGVAAYPFCLSVRKKVFIEPNLWLLIGNFRSNFSCSKCLVI